MPGNGSNSQCRRLSSPDFSCLPPPPSLSLRPHKDHKKESLISRTTAPYIAGNQYATPFLLWRTGLELVAK